MSTMIDHRPVQFHDGLHDELICVEDDEPWPCSAVSPTPRTVTAEGLRIAGAIGAGDLWLCDATVLMEPSPEYDDWLREGPATVRSMLASIRPLTLTPSDTVTAEGLREPGDDLEDWQRLVILAAWFDMWDRPETDRQAVLDDPRNPGRNDVQRDLRRIAEKLRLALTPSDPLDVDALETALAVSGWTPPPDSAVFGRYADPGEQHRSKVATVAAEYARLSSKADPEEQHG
jgi:hypothetical protein